METKVHKKTTYEWTKYNIQKIQFVRLPFPCFTLKIVLQKDVNWLLCQYSKLSLSIKLINYLNYHYQYYQRNNSPPNQERLPASLHSIIIIMLLHRQPSKCPPPPFTRPSVHHASPCHQQNKKQIENLKKKTNKFAKCRRLQVTSAEKVSGNETVEREGRASICRNKRQTQAGAS